jgi:hypothetical protein
MKYRLDGIFTPWYANHDLKLSKPWYKAKNYQKI